MPQPGASIRQPIKPWRFRATAEDTTCLRAIRFPFIKAIETGPFLTPLVIKEKRYLFKPQ
jgi:hypothetical protein